MKTEEGPAAFSALNVKHKAELFNNLSDQENFHDFKVYRTGKKDVDGIILKEHEMIVFVEKCVA